MWNSANKYKYEHLIVDLDRSGLATLTLNRPYVRNAFNHQMITELRQLFQCLEYDQEVKVVLLQGAGKAFCAGADLNWMKSMISFGYKENFQDAMRLAVMLEAIRNFSKPLIAKLHGATIGGGAGIACIADWVIAERGNSNLSNKKGGEILMGFPEPALGIRPSTISPHVIERLGAETALKYFLSGDIIHGEEAKEIGLIDELCSPESIDYVVRKRVKWAIQQGKKRMRRRPSAFSFPRNTRDDLTGNLAQIQGLVLQVVKLFNDPTISRADLMNYTAVDIAKARISAEGQKGMGAFLRKKLKHHVVEYSPQLG